MSEYKLFTSESVSEGHPDKMADQISDAVLDAMLKDDPESRVACETLVKDNLVVLAGEITSGSEPDLEALTRKVILDIGYNSLDVGCDGNTCEVINAIGKQSQDIAQGVNEGEGEDLEQGAGDQGLMFGYATNETEVLMPAPITYSHRLVEQQAFIRKSGKLSWLRPDAKSQVSFVYGDDGKPESISAVVLSTQHDPDVSQGDLKEGVMEEIVKPILPSNWLNANTKYFINPTGRFEIGGPVGDCGLTGRKIIVDTYGGSSPHGGGAFSGKDPTKVDRSAAYISRYMAKNVVAANLADKCTIQLSYAIGVSEPLSLYVNTANTGKISDQELAKILRKEVDLTPSGIRSRLGLNNSIYTPTASYGHFGRVPNEKIEGSFSWEKTDLANKIS